VHILRSGLPLGVEVRTRSWAGAPPSTMVFGGKFHGQFRLSDSKEDADATHILAVRRLMAGEPPFEADLPSDIDRTRAIEVLNKAAAVYDAHDARDAEFDQLPTRGGDSLRRVVAFLQKEKNTA
jgi:hypothetical protein